MTAGSEPRAADGEFVIRREFDAPRRLVFDAFADPSQIVKWFGPRMFTNRFEGEVRAGAPFRLTMIGPDGTEYPMRGEYLEVVRPERIIYSQNVAEHPESWHDLVNPDRDRTKPPPGNDAVVTVTFEARGERTLLTIHMRFESAAVRDRLVKTGMREGWEESFDRIGELIDGAVPLVVMRSIDAPRANVFAAWTDAEMLKRWWWPKGFQGLELSIDPRAGGELRYAMRGPDGATSRSRHRFVQFEPDERLAYVASFVDSAGAPVPPPFDGPWPRETLSTVSFVAESADRTFLLFTLRALHANEAERRAFDAAGAHMQESLTGTLDQLATVVAKEQP